MAFDIPQTPLERKLGEALQAASEYFGEPISRARVLDKTKCKRVVQPRQWVMAYLRWKHGDAISYPRIGRMLGGMHHTSVLHGERRAKELFPDAVFCPLPDLLGGEASDAA